MAPVCWPTPNFKFEVSSHNMGSSGTLKDVDTSPAGESGRAAEGSFGTAPALWEAFVRSSAVRVPGSIRLDKRCQKISTSTDKTSARIRRFSIQLSSTKLLGDWIRSSWVEGVTAGDPKGR